MRDTLLIIFGFLEFLIRVLLGALLVLFSLFMILIIVDYDDIFVPYLWKELSPNQSNKGESAK